MTRSSKDFPHTFLLSKNKHWETTAWCEQQFGKRWSVVDNREGVWCVFWRGRDNPGMYEWYFEHEQDASRFVLRWM